MPLLKALQNYTEQSSKEAREGLQKCLRMISGLSGAEWTQSGRQQLDKQLVDRRDQLLVIYEQVANRYAFRRAAEGRQPAKKLTAESLIKHLVEKKERNEKVHFEEEFKYWVTAPTFMFTANCFDTQNEPDERREEAVKSFEQFLQEAHLIECFDRDEIELYAKVFIYYCLSKKQKW
jgi:hypothetical protein